MSCRASLLIFWFVIIAFDVARFDVFPPRDVTAYPGQNVTLPCVVANYATLQTVRWLYVDEYETVITQNRGLNTTIIDKWKFSLLGEDNNFTLHIIIPENNVIDFEDDEIITKQFQCSVTSPSFTLKSSYSKVTIRKYTFYTPICLFNGTIYTSGQTLGFGCFADSDSNILTNLKSGKGQILPSNLISSTFFHIKNVTKEDNNAIYICESQRIGTNEIRSCSKGPITVNYKPEINITQISPLEFNCTAEAKPPVNETVWIVEPSIPEDQFTISNGILKFKKLSKVGSEITCEAENVLGKESESRFISLVDKKKEEKTMKNRFYFILLSIVVTIIIIITILLCYCKYKRNQANKTDCDHTFRNKRHIRKDSKNIEMIFKNEEKTGYETITTVDGRLTRQQEYVYDEPYELIHNKDDKTYVNIHDQSVDNTTNNRIYVNNHYLKNEIYEGATGGADSKEEGVQD